ncbi:peroxidase-like [Ostrinia furnacalis]|uniref:peroxidase-like n=1 Tax=Ostrinia furnacalis TaxID=93504 RepID=UPI00103A6AF2|nr:peroxidase-like [Ostrinia furnacalis]
MKKASICSSWCTNVLQPCDDPHEWRRIDASCNNMHHPNRGMGHTPVLRLLHPVFSGNCTVGYGPRTAKDGEPLPLERRLRTSLLPEARIPDQVFTQMFAHFMLFLVADLLSIHDTINYVLWKPYCCQPQGQLDPECAPVKIPADDPVHRFSNIRCMAMTKPLTFQSERCLTNDTYPQRLISSTPTIDLNALYGHSPERLPVGRLYKDGLLKYDLINGKMWPPAFKTADNFCYLNMKPIETRCHDTPDPVINSLAGINFFAIWFWRLHNHIALELSKLNPCWDDERLFYTARDINIAIKTQIVHYEMLAQVMGYENLVHAGVLSPSPGFRDLYDEDMYPQITAEYAYVLRWFHVIQENDQRMYDPHGHYLRSVPLSNLTLRTGFLSIDNNFDYITQGSFRQAGANFGSNVDPDLAEVGIGPLTPLTDLVTLDLSKNRHFGLAPYVNYLEYCNGRPYTSFEDLVGIIKPEMLEILKDRYENVEDIDLLAALWVELPAHGSFLPKTLQCLMIDQHIRFPMMDRHWYESPNRPHAFNLEQLLEIRKATVSQVLCTVGDKVTEIQPHGFLRDGPGNEITSCEHIQKINWGAWKDPTCGGSLEDHDTISLFSYKSV